MSTKKIAGMGVLSAAAIILAIIFNFPIFPAATFLKYDPADIPIFIGTFVYGPIAGLIITIIVSLIQGFTVSVDGGIIGIIMHIIATGSFVIVSGLIFTKTKGKYKFVISVVLGVLVWLIAMILSNIILTPIFTGAPRFAIIKMLLPIILPFNLIKVGINTTIFYFLYKAIEKPVLSKLTKI